MKPTVSITLFGRFSVRLGSETLLDHAPHKAQELLAYLILHVGKTHPRDRLAGVLWTDRDAPNARKNLRQALWHLHSGLLALGRNRAARVLHAENDWVDFELDDRVHVDASLFEDTFVAAKGVRGDALSAEQARSLTEAMQLYRGDLLEGWPVEWCAYDRDRFRCMYLTILDKLTDRCESRHDYEAALAYGTLALRHDQARERTHRSLIRLLAKAGDRTGALRQYERCAEALRDELGVEPEPETEALVQHVRAGFVVGAVRECVPTEDLRMGSVPPSRLPALQRASRNATSRVPS